MARTTWFNDNEFRAYPFVEEGYPYDGDTPVLPLATVVDCGFLFSPTAAFDEKTHRVSLTRVERTASSFRFVFQTTALPNRQLVFTVNDDAPEFTHLVAEVGWPDEVSWSLSVSECGELTEWEGFLVVGNLADLKAKLPVDSALTVNIAVEPTTVVALRSAYVTSLYVANVARTRCEAPEGCPPLEWPGPLPAVPVVGCVAGPVRLVPGYNCHIAVDTAANSITIHAVTADSGLSGAGAPTGEVPQFVGEAPPASRTRLDGALHCYEVFRTINGLPGPVIELVAEDGIALQADAETHTWIVDVNMTGMTVCSPGGMGPNDEVSCSECDPCG